MKASDVMTIGAISVQPDSTVAHAARVMLEHGVSGLPVVTGGGKLVGIISERDLLRRKELGTAGSEMRWLDFWLDADRLAHQYAREHGRKVEDVMSRKVISVAPDARLSDVVTLMESHQIKRVPVVRDGKLAGMISRANLLSALVRLAGEIPEPVVGDMAIRKTILDEIAGKPWAPDATLDILVRDGVVTLNGTVDSEDIRDAVRVAAENAPGAVRIWDNIRVVPRAAD